MGGPNGYVPIGLPDDKLMNPDEAGNGSHLKRARVLCSYDASGTTELNLTANEVSSLEKTRPGVPLNIIQSLTGFRLIPQVIFVSECSPPNPDYMYGKQGLLKGLVPRAFLEMLDD